MTAKYFLIADPGREEVEEEAWHCILCAQ